VDLNHTSVQPVKLGRVPRPRLQLKHVYAIYTGQFRRWFGITAPTSVLAAVVVLLADQRVRAIYRGIPIREIQYHWGEISETYVLRLGSFFISWFLGCFALAAIATAVNGLDADNSDDVWRRDSYQSAREHFGALLLTALLTFCAFLAGMAVIGFVMFALIKVAAWSHFARFNLVASVIGYAVIASIVS
jgi:lysylphosphatidylglycerol synthetase-like protein (DUF2156 family)